MTKSLYDAKEASAIYDERDPRWSPDGELIVFRSNHAYDPDLDPDAEDIFVMSAEGGEPRLIETPIGPKEKPVFSPDGRWLAYLGKEGRGQSWRNTRSRSEPYPSSHPPTLP